MMDLLRGRKSQISPIMWWEVVEWEHDKGRMRSAGRIEDLRSKFEMGAE